jgi:hypothetical protein
MTPIDEIIRRRHGRACPGHPLGDAESTPRDEAENAWLSLVRSGARGTRMAGTSPAMTSHCFRPLI